MRRTLVLCIVGILGCHGSAGTHTDAGADYRRDATAERGDGGPGPEAAVDLAREGGDVPGAVDSSGAGGITVDAGSGGAGGGTIDAGSGGAGGATIDAGAGGAGGAQVDAGSGGAGGTIVDAGSGGAGGAGTGGAGGTPGSCVSGATGTYAARFRWAASGSTAYVVYEANTLPDSARWHVSAGSNSSPIGFTPAFVDPFLGPGGLDLGSSVFMDVELSTAGLASLSRATIAIYGRSYNVTTSGSFTWQTFTGTGAAPTNLVSNVAPYAWYQANATAAFRPGDSGVLLRLRAGPSSNALVVNRVEICFATN